jgi:hypothetical protein
MLTAPSSNTVVQFTQKFPTWESFNRWREAYLGVVIADRSIGHRAKTVAAVIYLHLSKKTGACFPGYSEIARCAGIRRQNAVEAVKELVAAGHLRKLSRQDKAALTPAICTSRRGPHCCQTPRSHYETTPLPTVRL